MTSLYIRILFDTNDIRPLTLLFNFTDIRHANFAIKGGKINFCFSAFNIYIHESLYVNLDDCKIDIYKSKVKSMHMYFVTYQNTISTLSKSTLVFPKAKNPKPFDSIGAYFAWIA